MSAPRVLVVVPCYNEESSVARLLREVADLDKGFEVLVIDDGSEDDTFAVARCLSSAVRLTRNLGIGGAVQTGIKYAAQNNFDLCVQIDGDGQHPPEHISTLLQAYVSDPAEIVIGSRFLGYESFRSTWTRRLGGRVIAWALNHLFSNCHISDPTSGMRLMDRQAIRFFARHYPYDFPEPISLAWALRAGMRVRDVAVAMRAREHGRTSIAGIRPLIYMFRVLGYILLARLKRTPLV